MNDMEEKLKCAFADIGTQVGDMLRCIIQSEVAVQVSRIQQLQAVLNGTTCNDDVMPTTLVSV
jgi:hypothetical protein